MKRRRNRAEWVRIIHAWRESGETAKAFAGKHKLNAGTMKWWAYRLPKECGGSEENALETASLIEVVGRPREPASQPERVAAVRLVVGGSIAMAFDELPRAAYLAEFVGALAGVSR